MVTAANTRIYVNQGHGEVQFHTDANNALSVEIRTKNLFMRSVMMNDLGHITSLFGNPQVMAKFATGLTINMMQVYERMKVWIKRWAERDPYSPMAVYHKDTNQFVGLISLGHGDRPGESEIAFLQVSPNWNKGYGSEAAKAMVKAFAPATVREGFKLEGKPLTKIVATARPDNPASCKILEKLGMHLDKKEHKFGALRNHYSLDPNAAQETIICTVSALLLQWLNCFSMTLYSMYRSLATLGGRVSCSVQSA